MSARADGWIKWTTIGCVGPPALVAGTVSYLHMLAVRGGQLPGVILHTDGGSEYAALRTVKAVQR
jgi:hypothetical protein